ncbi:hypothetical protein R5R35_008256 [Gryllus longicercus]|uniref:Uncharacterized protein n=1 Tax=Gryllus longicercus TaxID=2509291 RepID=A0AAN9ZAD6_9ORTH
MNSLPCTFGGVHLLKLALLCSGTCCRVVGAALAAVARALTVTRPVKYGSRRCQVPEQQGDAPLGLGRLPDFRDASCRVAHAARRADPHIPPV